MPPFSLLRLPSLALAEILKCLNPVELFILALCSQKASNIIPLSNSKKFILNCDCPLKITINGYYHFHMERDNLNWLESVKSRSIRNTDTKLCFKYADKKNTVFTFWKHEFNGKKELSLYLSNLFKCPLDSIGFDTNISVDWIVDFVEQISQNQIKIQKVSISKSYNANPSADNLKKILKCLENLEIISYLYINCPLAGNFDNTFDRLPKYLEISNAIWFSKENLFSIDNCELVDLTDSLFENEDLDEFLDLWKAGRYSNLKYLYIQGRRLRDQEPIGRLSKLFDPLSKSVRTKNLSGRLRDIQGGVEIHRDNGQRADIRLYWDFDFHFTLFVHEDTDIVREY